MLKNRRQIFASILALLIALIMVLSMGAAMVSGEEMVQDTSDAQMAETMSVTEEIPAEESGESGTGGSLITGGSAMAGFSAENAVFIDNINITGLTREEIVQAVDARMQELSKQVIILYAGRNSARVTAGELGLTYNNTDVIDEALSIGNSGNVLKRFLADRYLNSRGNIILDLDFSVSRELAEAVIYQNLGLLNSEPKSNGLKLNDNNTFTMTESRDGVVVNVETSIDKLVDYMDNEWHGGQGGVCLDAEISEAGDASDQLKRIKDLLGSASTNYATGNTNHDTNVELAAKNIDGTVIYPGEEFSASQAIGPTTEEYGFLPASSYEAGKIVDTYGGGVCQVTSCLYCAMLEAELEVTERHNHSYLVSYVTPGFDATIAENLLDYRFVNNTEAPIYIQAILKNGTLIFNFYGEEYRPSNRTIEYNSVYKDTEDVENAYETDANQAFGTILTGGGIMGVEAELWKYIYIDGELDSQELVNYSKYDMLPFTYTVGTKNADAETLQAINQAVANEDYAAIQYAVGFGSVIQQEVGEN